jgi:hypothetical protein
MNQLPSPSKSPYLFKEWLKDEMPRGMLFEIFEQPDTASLFKDAIEQQKETQFSPDDYHLPIESKPAFADLLEHLSDHSIVGNINSLKKQSLELAFGHGVLIGILIQSIKDNAFAQYYAGQLTASSGYGELIRVVLASQTY